jgi:hypothetical protein
LGVIVGYSLLTYRRAQTDAVHVYAVTTSELIPVNTTFFDQNTSLWGIGIDVIVDGSQIKEPAIVENVEVYVKVRDENTSWWLQAERSALASVGYDYWGDSIIVPGEKARIKVPLFIKHDYEPLEAIVVMKLRGVGVVYSNVVQLKKTG